MENSSRSRSGHSGRSGIDAQVVEVERGQDLGAGEGAAQVAAVAVVDHLQHVQPELLGAAVQLAHEARGMVMGMPHAPEPKPHPSPGQGRSASGRTIDQPPSDGRQFCGYRAIRARGPQRRWRLAAKSASGYVLGGILRLRAV